MPLPPPISMGPDGYYHPESEIELIGLVKWAHAGDRQLRVRGSGHTFPSKAIHTDRAPGETRREVNVMLNRYRAVTWLDEQQGIVEVQAGCNLSLDPYDPTHTSTLENGLLYQLQQKGWTLSDLGGITHQTVSGFLSTGSSGGSLKFSIEQNIVGFRFIDGTGEVHEVSRNQADLDLFHAVGVSMGLLGVVSVVRLQCVPTFNIRGSESTTTEAGCEVDLFGPGTPSRPSLETFLRETEYTRLIWWPQAQLQRVVIWKAARIKPEPGFVPKPYQEVGADPELKEIGAGLLLSIIGNLSDLRAWPAKIEPIFTQIDSSVLDELKGLGFNKAVSDALSAIVSGLLELGVDGFAELPGLESFGQVLKRNLAEIVPVAFKPFVPLDPEKTPPGPQQFQDYGYCGLAMDNGVDDWLMPTWFTEIWIPISKAQAVMTALRDHFAAGGLSATGTFCFEIYGTRRSEFWMSPSSDGDGDGVVRVDVFWNGYNAGNPAIDLYPQFWQLLAPFGFKLHWGKFLPLDPPPEKRWATYFSRQYSRWDAFLKLRAKLDPKNIFLTAYWREHLGLEQALPKGAEPVPLPAPDLFTTEAWAAAQRAITLYSWLLLCASAYALLIAHVPYLLGDPWTTCDDATQAAHTGCIVAYHFWEMPIVLYFATFALLGLRGLRRHVHGYSIGLNFNFVVLAAFLPFEVRLLIDGYHRQAPTWEIVATYSAAALAWMGLGIGLWTRVKLSRALRSEVGSEGYRS